VAMGQDHLDHWLIELSRRYYKYQVRQPQPQAAFHFAHIPLPASLASASISSRYSWYLVSGG